MVEGNRADNSMCKSIKKSRNEIIEILAKSRTLFKFRFRILFKFKKA